MNPVLRALLELWMAQMIMGNTKMVLTGLTSFLHCGNFKELLPKTAEVKCLGDAAFFVDEQDIIGFYHIRSYFNEHLISGDSLSSNT